jgi:glycosyltransferase involved in cell wall biosynthesis
VIDFSKSPFGQRQVQIPEDTEIVFVADAFAADYIGGAELTSEALIEKSPFKLFKLHSRNVTREMIRLNVDKFWLFGNFADISAELINEISRTLRYSVLEYDSKYCSIRSPEKHIVEGTICNCHNESRGKLISDFYCASKHMFWMSEKQLNRQVSVLPALASAKNTVLSSVFSDETLDLIRALRERNLPRQGWLVMDHPSWIKGTSQAIKWCVDNNKAYELVGKMTYGALLEKLSHAEGLVYVPPGADTCPRLCIEAKLLGCSMILNGNVEHMKEPWFDSNDLGIVETYLRGAPKRFWDIVSPLVKKKATISGYTTVLNCVRQEYPYIQCITSMLGFCDEVCVVDGGSDDGTWKKLFEWATREPRLKLVQVPRDWNHPRHAVFDGAQKAEARKMCVGDFCWQMDSDEIVHEDDYNKIHTLMAAMPADVEIISLPVLEWWGNKGKVRVDVIPHKWRLSRNLPHITHGIPKELRCIDANGDLYAVGGTDGCDMVHATTFERLSHATFYRDNAENVRQAAMQGSEEALAEYSKWFNAVIEQIPGVVHYSWYDIARKMQVYRVNVGMYGWQHHWHSLWDADPTNAVSDVPDNNMFFDCAWKDVNDGMLIARAQELEEKCGGHVFHTKWVGQHTPSINVKRGHPAIMR